MAQWSVTKATAREIAYLFALIIKARGWPIQDGRSRRQGLVTEGRGWTLQPFDLQVGTPEGVLVDKLTVLIDDNTYQAALRDQSRLTAAEAVDLTALLRGATEIQKARIR